MIHEAGGKPTVGQVEAENLLHGLVAVPSLSRQETAASQWLVSQMVNLGYTQAFVDDAGNATGEVGRRDAETLIVLLGHIDTVPGVIPVRIDEQKGRRLLFGRGAVDAKGPLATFVAAAARLGEQWANQMDVRLVVVGAVEEEAATSKGARHVVTRFGGKGTAAPDACVIGEPSGWQRLTLGYKGRLLVNIDAKQPMSHSAGPDTGIGTVAVDLWNWMWNFAQQYNAGRERVFEQLTPSLRYLNTSSDESMVDRVQAQIGIRLPLGFEVADMVHSMLEWLALRLEAPKPAMRWDGGGERQLSAPIPGATVVAEVTAHGFEPAWRGERDTMLVRSFLSAVRKIDADVRPAFVVKTGTSDMNVVGPVWQCPIAAYGPGDSSLDHTPNEHLDLDEYWSAILILEEMLRTLGQHLKHTG